MYSEYGVKFKKEYSVVRSVSFVEHTDPEYVGLSIVYLVVAMTSNFDGHLIGSTISRLPVGPSWFFASSTKTAFYSKKCIVQTFLRKVESSTTFLIRNSPNTIMSQERP
jgi:hypothetical protein